MRRCPSSNCGLDTAAQIKRLSEVGPYNTARVMAKGDWIAVYRKIDDHSRIESYRKLAGPVMQASGGRPLVRGDPVKTYEAGLNQRVVIIEYDTIEQALALHD